MSAPWSTERGVVDRADVVLGELGREPGDSVSRSGMGRLRLNSFGQGLGGLYGPLLVGMRFVSLTSVVGGGGLFAPP